MLNTIMFHFNQSKDKINTDKINKLKLIALGLK